MHIDHPQAGDGQEVSRQDPSVRRDNAEIGVEFRHLISKVGLSKPRRLQHHGPERERGRLHF